ncbi:hypothetical protein OE987_003102 [Vibrio cholerae]|nr:hypothetical protein [Vibrio cholerae]
MFLIVFFGIFLSSIISHGAVVNAIGALIIISFAFYRGYLFKLSRVQVVIISLVSVFIVFNAFVFLLEFGFNPAQASRDAFLNNLLMFFILLLYSISLSSIIIRKRELVNRSLYWILIINLVFFIIQFITVYASGHYLDAVHLFTGEESRYQNYFLQGAASHLVEYRVTGLYVEPSTYVAALCTLSTAYRLLTNKIGLYISVIITCVMTFSTISFIVAVIMAVSLLKKSIIWRSVIFALASLVPIVIIFNDFFISAVDDFFLKMALTSGERLDLVHMIYYLDEKLNLIGYGLFSIPEKIHILASTGVGQYRIASVNDAGLINFIGMKFGLIGVSIVLLFVFSRFGYQKLMMCLSVLITKISFMFPLFIVVLIPFLLDKYRDRHIV